MCGIYGAVILQPGKKWDLGIIRALTWANRERGTDSLGFFDSSGKMIKGAGDPSEVLCKSSVKRWLSHSRDTSWFVAGHTRFATRGKVNRRNSHPFRYGRIIGSHNGMCSAPAKFQVDSEYLFFLLNKARGDYQKALQSVSGYWGLSWFDGKHFYLLNHNGELAYDIIDGVLYYSSSWSHLDSCTGGDSSTLKEGQVLRICADGTIANSLEAGSPIKSFESSSMGGYSYNGGYGYYGRYDDDEIAYYCGSKRQSAGHTRNATSGGRGSAGRKESSTWQHEQDADGATVRDYDSDWQEAWADYCSQSEHSNTGEEDWNRYTG